MRADFFSRIVSVIRPATLILISLGLVACKTEKDPDQPTILGIPPGNAYLGVEYYYNFGAYGGEDILDYSLTNAPSWLALEDTSNKARQGIIMRGVPGLTGGRRGEADLGKVKGINLVTTDGRMAGVQPFDIDVRYNPLTLDAETFTEGESLTVEPPSRDEHCKLPDVKTPGEHSFTISEYNEDGSVAGPRELTVATHPVIARIRLGQPSVTRVSVAFEITSQYNPSDCDTGFSPPHQRCDQSDSNDGNAILGQDIVAWGSGSSDEGNESYLEQPEYLTYEQDTNGVYTGGVVTFEPGITECYIRLEVVDDTFAEPSESAKLRLTEVRSGLAGLGENNGGARANLVIEDDEPLLTLETAAGGVRDTLNVGAAREYVAILSGDRENEFHARLGPTDDSTARLDTEFVTERLEGATWVESKELVFPAGVDKVPFRIRVPATGYDKAAMDDRFILLDLDEAYQAGREYFVRSAEDNVLRVSLNELTTPLAFAGSGGFQPTDFEIAHSGRIFVAGFDRQDNDRVRVRIYDQEGILLQDIAVSGAGDVLSQPEPVIATVRRKVSEGSAKVDRFEFAVAYSTDSAVLGTVGQGGADVVTSRYWFDSATNGGEYIRNWTLRTGTPSDDFVRSVDLDADSGFVLIGGETRGTWPGQAPTGGTDSFLQRIDTELDGTDEVPALAWTRQVGSASDDAVAGVSASALTPLLFGSAQGAVNGAPVRGGIDPYFYSTSSGTGALTVHQVGTGADEPVAAGTFAHGLLWLLGNSHNTYSVVQASGEENTLASTPGDSQAGFLLGYSVNGSVRRAFTLNDEGDQATERFEAVAGFAGDMVVGGATDGDFAENGVAPSQEQGVIARVSLEQPDASGSKESVFVNEWRYQLAEGDSELLVLGNYRDDEIAALARRGSDRALVLFSPEGELLTPLN